ncbi:MAG: class I SAM-dependent methyltransferase, partial [Gemmatimonadetes bacterium]|nr:class I SAM-dependent methyltransferase [Gemmatimonadota bacterium]
MSKRPRKTLPADFELPYSELAQIYDHVMRHVDYIRWADYIQSVFTRFEATPKDVLELACGTGAMACILDDRGYRMTGIDRSERMIAVAKRKSVDASRA